MSTKNNTNQCLFLRLPAMNHNGSSILRVAILHFFQELEHANRSERDPKIGPAGEVELGDKPLRFLSRHVSHLIHNQVKSKHQLQPVRGHHTHKNAFLVLNKVTVGTDWKDSCTPVLPAVCKICGWCSPPVPLCLLQTHGCSRKSNSPGPASTGHICTEKQKTDYTHRTLIQSFSSFPLLKTNGDQPL